jgi:hypothetical protein
MQKSRKHVGTCFEQIKPQKAMWQSKMSFYVDKGSINGRFSELCGFSKRGCALQEEIAHILKGGAPLTLWLIHVLIG